jgi:hypothetical protein
MTQNVTIQGTLAADGTLHLDEKPNLPPGRVTVVVQVLPEMDPFWQRMNAIKAIPRTKPDDGGENTLEEVERMRKEWDEHQGELERPMGHCGR